MTRVDLRDRATWNMATLTAETFQWPTTAPRVALRQLISQIVAPKSVVQAGVQVVTPDSIDEETGGIRRRSWKYQGSVFQVKRDLEVGDLLVAPRPETPALLVTENLRGALVSSRFTALRTSGAATPLWIWAVLNSTSGHDLRHRSSLGSFHPGVPHAQILDIEIPVPPLTIQREIGISLRSIESTTHINDEEEAPPTWWRIADLRGSEWRLQLANPTPDLLNDGPPLSTYAEKIELGRVLRGEVTDVPDAGLPVIDGAALSGKPIRRWLRGFTHPTVIAEAGDVLVAAIGVRARATVVTGDAAVDRSAIRIRLKEPRHAEAVARYLNGTAGYAYRQMSTSLATIPRVSVADLSRMPLPSEALRGTASPTISLAERLEQTLWGI